MIMGIHGETEKWKRQRHHLFNRTKKFGVGSYKELESLVLEFCDIHNLRSYGGAKWHCVTRNEEKFMNFIKDRNYETD